VAGPIRPISLIGLIRPINLIRPIADQKSALIYSSGRKPRVALEAARAPQGRQIGRELLSPFQGWLTMSPRANRGLAHLGY
jgi:hypothetical protein